MQALEQPHSTTWLSCSVPSHVPHLEPDSIACADAEAVDALLAAAMAWPARRQSGSGIGGAVPIAIAANRANGVGFMAADRREVSRSSEKHHYRYKTSFCMLTCSDFRVSCFALHGELCECEFLSYPRCYEMDESAQ